MGHHIVGIGLKIRLMGMGYLNGAMEDNTKGTGWIIKCMGTGSTRGLMEENMKENSNMMLNKDLAKLFLLIECRSLKDTGRMVYNMEKEG